MINVILDDKTELTYNTFDEITIHDKIIELNCSHNNFTFIPDSIGYLEYTN